MGLFDWLRPRPRRSSRTVAEELASVVLAMHPGAERVEVTLDGRRVAAMTVTGGDPARAAAASPDRGADTARVAELAAELAALVPTSGPRFVVMADRVIWMPAVVPFARG